MQDFGQPVGAQGPPPPPGYGGPPPPGYGAPPPPGYGPPPQQRSKLPLVAGIMFILAVVILFVNLGLAAAWLGAVETMADRLGTTTEEARDVLNMLWAQCVVIPLIGAIFLLLASVFSFKHKNFKMVLIGGIIGMVCAIIGSVIVVAGITGFNIIAFLGFIFALLGVILAAAGKKGFD